MEKQRSSRRVRRKKNEYSKMIVSLIVLMNIIFTVVVFFCFLQTGTEPSALIAAWFSFTTIELWSLSRIKNKKIEREIKQDMYRPEGWG